MKVKDEDENFLRLCSTRLQLSNHSLRLAAAPSIIVAIYGLLHDGFLITTKRFAFSMHPYRRQGLLNCGSRVFARAAV